MMMPANANEGTVAYELSFVCGGGGSTSMITNAMITNAMMLRALSYCRGSLLRCLPSLANFFGVRPCVLQVPFPDTVNTGINTYFRIETPLSK